MVNEDDIERVIGGPVKRAIVAQVRMRPGITPREIQSYLTKTFSRIVTLKTLKVHIAQINKTLRIHKYEIRNYSRYRASYRLVSLKGPQ